jgi:hypothetical protein
MGFLLNGKPLQEGVPFYDSKGTQYPSGWLNQSTEEEKKAIGVIWVADPVRLDDRFWWDGNPNNPKALEDKEETDSEGNKSVTKGLKSQFIAQIKQTAGSLLSQTDWYVIRKAERNIDIPSKVASERAKIVAEADRLEAAITECEYLEPFIKVVTNQKWN